MTTPQSNFKKNKNPEFSKGEKFAAIPVIIFVFSVLILLIYLAVTHFNWKIALGVFFFGVLLNLSILAIEKVLSAVYSGAKNEPKRKEKVSSFIGFLFFGVVCFIMTYFIWQIIAGDIKKRILYRKITSEEAIVSLQKTRQEIFSALSRLDSSINALNTTKKQIELVITQTEAEKAGFLKHIEDINTAEAVAKKLDENAKERGKVLANIQKMVGGKEILTIDEYEKGKTRDLIIGFFMGIITSVIGSFFIVFIRRRSKDLN